MEILNIAVIGHQSFCHNMSSIILHNEPLIILKLFIMLTLFMFDGIYKYISLQRIWLYFTN